MSQKNLAQVKHSTTVDMYYHEWKNMWRQSRYYTTEILLDTHAPNSRNTSELVKRREKEKDLQLPIRRWYTNNLLEYIQLLKAAGMLENDIFEQLTTRDQYEFFLLKRYNKSTLDIFQLALYQPELMTVEVKRYRRQDGEDVENT